MKVTCYLCGKQVKVVDDVTEKHQMERDRRKDGTLCMGSGQKARGGTEQKDTRVG